MNYLVLDTETDGKFINKKYPLDHKSQGNIVQLGFSLYKNKSIMMELNTLIKPEFFSFIEPEAYEVHKIEFSDCEIYGLPLKIALNTLYKAILNTDIIVGHSIDFDIGMISSAYSKCGAGRNIIDYINEKPKYCTMQNSKNILKLPNKNTKGYKRPSLNECYNYFFGEDIVDAHDAMVDVDSCAKILFELIKLNPIEM
jgi:DNA polymerase III subunit epsilon